MRRILAVLVALSFLQGEAIAAPRVYGAFGTASSANTQLTVPFTPNVICATNGGGANMLYVDISGDGVAATTPALTNFQVKPGATKCWTELSKNPMGTYLIGVITGPAVSTEYEIEAIF